MTYKEAQEASPIGVAVYGNWAMKDVVWPKDQPQPYYWLTNGYRPCTEEMTNRIKDRDWESLDDDPKWTFRLYKREAL